MTNESQKALNQWLDFTGATYHDCDIQLFNKFALEYCKNGDKIEETPFVKMVKLKTPNTKDNRGIAQKYFRRLEAIKSFVKDNKLHL